MDLLNEIKNDIEKIIKIDPKKIDYKNKEADFEKINMEKEDYISYVSNIKNLDELNASILTIEFTIKKIVIFGIIFYAIHHLLKQINRLVNQLHIF